MANLLAGQRALVTGAGRGIGVAIARALAAEGAAVAIAYRHSRVGAEDLVRALRAEGKTAVALGADLTDATQAHDLVAEATAALGGIDILVNNAAGFGPLRPLADTIWDDIDTEWQAVVRPMFLATSAILPGMRAQRHGRIVNLSATLLQRPASGQGAHAMAKAAVLSYTRSLAREIGPDGVTVNAVSPGMTLTQWSLAQPEREKAAVAARTPLRRLATPDDVAGAVVFFCSPLAAFITGANLAPDGGLAVL
jgi:3-oxoacyl-[acyl-carrier protein] reductase